MSIEIEPLAWLKEQAAIQGKDGRALAAEDLGDNWEVIESGEWTQDHKYQLSTDIVKHAPTGRHFAIHNSRSGSHHTDWYYNEPHVNEVMAQTKTVTITEWVAA
jgi:hypothetical protein